MAKQFSASWSNSLKLTTLLFSGIILLAALVTPRAGGLIFAAILLASTLFYIRGYSVGNGEVAIYGLGWNKVYDLGELVSVEARPYVTNGSFRTFGNGFVFSILGYYRNNDLGNYLAFVTDHKNAVVLDFQEKRIVVSPDNPEAFVRAVREEYSRTHRRAVL